MRKTLILSLAAATTVAFGGVAYAQADAQPAPERAERAPLTRAEVEQRTNEAFGRMDANDDGVLNQADREAREKAAFDRIDADKDGAISLAEFSARDDQRREARAERGEPGGPDGAGFGRRGGRGGPGFAFGGADGPRAADTDGDGAVSQAEFSIAALARFDQADADKNGTISREERRSQWRDRRGDRRSARAD